MTVPTEPGASTPGGVERAAVRSVVQPRKPWSRRRAVVAGIGGVGLLVVVLVLAVPGLAAPIGTAAGVVAVAVPLGQWLCREGRTDQRGSADEP